jgi:hypothetical protein
MIAQLAPAPSPTPLPLLVEPLEPHPQARIAWGWRITDIWGGRRSRHVLTRHHADDARGAFAQHVVVRYIVHGVERQRIARETGFSERQVQAYIGGRACEPYTLAVLAALKELGLSVGRGRRWTDGTGRHAEIIRAQAALLDSAVHLLRMDGSDEAQALRAKLRLLLAGREPLTGVQV